MPAAFSSRNGRRSQGFPGRGTALEHVGETRFAGWSNWLARVRAHRGERDLLLLQQLQKTTAGLGWPELTRTRCVCVFVCVG
jgi:hypothetical protein